MKKVLMAVVVCGSYSLFAMNPDTSLVLGNFDTCVAMPRTKSLSMVEHTGSLDRITHDRDDDTSLKKKNPPEAYVFSVLKQNNCSCNEDELKKMVEDGKLKVTGQNIIYSLSPNNSRIVVTVGNYVENSLYHYSDKYVIKILTKGTPQDYEIHCINEETKTATLYTVWWPIVLDIDDALNNKLGLADKTPDGRFTLKSNFCYTRYYDMENPVTIDNLDNDFWEKYKAVNKKLKAKDCPEYWHEKHNLELSLIPIAKQRQLGKIDPQQVTTQASTSIMKEVEGEAEESDSGTSWRRYSEKGFFKYCSYRRPETREHYTRPEGTIFCERTEGFEKTAKPKPAAPIDPTRIMLLEALGLSHEAIVNYIYKISLDRMRNEFRLIVAPTLHSSYDRFALVHLYSSHNPIFCSTVRR